MPPVPLLLALQFVPLAAEPPAAAAPGAAAVARETSPVIPPGGNDWATVVRDPIAGRVDIIDGVKQPGRTVASQSEGQTQIYLNRGVPEALPLPAAALAELARHHDARADGAAAAAETNQYVRLLEPPEVWSLVVTGGAKLSAAAADRLNTVTPSAPAGGEGEGDGRGAGGRIWAAGDFAVQVAPYGKIRVASLPFRPDAEQVEQVGTGDVSWVAGRPEVWRYRGGAWTLITPGLPSVWAWAHD